jgi:hypothetical protein
MPTGTWLGSAALNEAHITLGTLIFVHTAQCPWTKMGPLL